eukprot:6193172-Pleurochrysis_carterae.AAC.2
MFCETVNKARARYLGEGRRSRSYDDDITLSESHMLLSASEDGAHGVSVCARLHADVHVDARLSAEAQSCVHRSGSVRE